MALREMLLKDLVGPPGRTNEAGYRTAMREVLTHSASLDDRKKIIAECECPGAQRSPGTPCLHVCWHLQLP